MQSKPRCNFCGAVEATHVANLPAEKLPLCDHCDDRCNRLFIVLCTNAHEPGVRHAWNFCSTRCLIFWLALSDATGGWLKRIGIRVSSDNPDAFSVGGWVEAPTLEDIAGGSAPDPFLDDSAPEDLYVDDHVKVF